MMFRLLPLLLVAGLLAGCATPNRPPPQQQVVVRSGSDSSGGVSEQSFEAVVNRVMPVAVDLCRARGVVSNCNMRVYLDSDPRAPANAFQTLDRNGRPIIIVTSKLLKKMRNLDEVAFVLGHEAAHQIEGHIPKTQASAQSGAMLAGVLVAASGGNADAIRAAQDLGAVVGSRSYSKSFELEADQVGTIITRRSGYDPVRGVAFFTRLPDPGDKFLGTHPPNADRIQIVQQTAARFR